MSGLCARHHSRDKNRQVEFRSAESRCWRNSIVSKRLIGTVGRFVHIYRHLSTAPAPDQYSTVRDLCALSCRSLTRPCSDLLTRGYRPPASGSFGTSRPEIALLANPMLMSIYSFIEYRCNGEAEERRQTQRDPFSRHPGFRGAGTGCSDRSHHKCGRDCGRLAVYLVQDEG